MKREWEAPDGQVVVAAMLKVELRTYVWAVVCAMCQGSGCGTKAQQEWMAMLLAAKRELRLDSSRSNLVGMDGHSQQAGFFKLGSGKVTRYRVSPVESE